MFSRRGRVEDGRGMQMVGQANIDGVNTLTHLGEHVFPVIEAPGISAELPGTRVEIRIGNVAQGDAFDFIGVLQDADGVRSRNAAGADQGQFDFCAHRDFENYAVSEEGTSSG